MQKTKGFTIIELLVVIAIIAVLAAVVLVNVTQYIAKGKNASIKANLSTAVTDGAVYFDTNSAAFGSTYVGSTDITNIKNAIVGAGGTTAQFGMTTDQNWCLCAMEIPTGTTGTVFCVDGTGSKKETAATTCTIQCVTPATGKCL